MPHVLVIYESRFGQSAKIAAHAGDVARRCGLDVRVLHVELARQVELNETDAFVVVAPIYFGRHTWSIERFLRKRADVLSRKPTAFVSVSNSAASAEPRGPAKARWVAHRFAARTSIHPKITLIAGGAIAYPRYNFVMKRVMRMIAKREGAPTDMSRVHELTRWPELDARLVPFFEALAETSGKKPAAANDPQPEDEPADDTSGVFSIRDHVVHHHHG